MWADKIPNLTFQNPFVRQSIPHNSNFRSQKFLPKSTRNEKECILVGGGLSRETISLLYLPHIHFSCGIFFYIFALPIPQCIAKNSNAISSILKLISKMNINLFIFIQRNGLEILQFSQIPKFDNRIISTCSKIISEIKKDI